MRTLWSLGLLFGALAAGCADDATDSCSMTVAAYCANGNCPMTWDAAQQPASWGCDATHQYKISLSTCADVRIATDAGTDNGQKYYYDASGHLYRVESYNVSVKSANQCIAGTGHAVACSDPNPVSVCTTP
jgi:hypothetical protein